MTVLKPLLICTWPARAADHFRAQFGVNATSALRYFPLITCSTRLNDADALPAALREAQWLFFTSQNAVTALQTHSRWAELKALCQSKQIAAIGAATASALEQADLRPSFVPPATLAGAAQVAQAFAAQVAPAPVLWPCAFAPRPELEQVLAAHGFSITRWPVYETLPLAPGDAAWQHLLADCAHHARGLVVFKSPSAVEAWANLAGAMLASCPIDALAIGPTTLAAVQVYVPALFECCFVSAQATEKSLAEAAAVWLQDA
ncbi:MAG: uroporphyrinogen-III synthase [Vampirovibrionales bacterium]|nr:uroporphyrinogen-III synthase [Vampirovibrionales bacterium]